MQDSAIGVIGMGWVGSSVAMSILHAGAARELLLHDLRTAVAEGEAMDLSHGAAFYSPATVRVASIEEMRDRTRAIVIAAGMGAMPGGDDRLAALQQTVGIIRALGAQLHGYSGLVIVVTNPVDVLTAVFARAADLPAERVIGTGTMLDTARLRQVLGTELGLEANSIHAYVVGEHGDSEVVLWTSARVGATALRSWPGWDSAREQAIADEVRRAGYEIVRRKGATNHAIGLVTARLLRGIMRGERHVLAVSKLQEAGEYRGVALSLPTIVGGDGATRVVTPELAPEERAGLDRSAEVLRRALGSVGEGG
jgi:L-lactate dehydrogenase